MCELNAAECVFYQGNCNEAMANGYSMVKCYAALATQTKVKRASDTALTLHDRRIPYRTILFMQDIGSDYKSPPQAVDLPENYVELALKNVACLHATYWGKYDSKTNPNWKAGSMNPVENCVWLSELVIAGRVK